MLNILAKKSKVGVRPSCKTWPQEPLTSQSRCLSASRPRVSWHRRETADSPRAWSRALQWRSCRTQKRSNSVSSSHSAATSSWSNCNIKSHPRMPQMHPVSVSFASEFPPSPRPDCAARATWHGNKNHEKYCGCLDEKSAANTHVKAQSPTSLLARSMHAVIIIRSIGCTRLGHDLHRI